MTPTERLAVVLPLLTEWYRQNKKDLPWRREPTPYHVWISEIMLQQTRIEAVIPYYERFLKELPDLRSLAEVPEEKLMKLWQGLGYYSRARNLKKAAEKVMSDYGGELPADAKKLRSLPGIGDYTAGAIASIAYGLPEPAVDGNVLRVVMRLTARDDDIMLPEIRTRTANELRSLYPAGREAGLLTEGLMELGELVCIPNGEAKCENCPVASHCLAREVGRVDELPVRIVKSNRKKENRTVFLLSDGERFALDKRPEKGLLAGMYEFPNVPGELSEKEAKKQLAEWGIQVKKIKPCGKTKHIFTHIEWQMAGYLVECELSDRFLFRTAAEILSDYAVPTAFSFYTKQLF